MNMKRISALLLALILCAGMLGCDSAPAEPAPEVVEEPAEVGGDLVNPVNIVSSYEELCAAQPAVKMNDAPEDAENVTYAWIRNIPVICEISFTYEGMDYCYRAAECSGAAAVIDISGVYVNYPSISAVSFSPVNEAGGVYAVRYDPETTDGIAAWYYEPAGCQYSLYTASGCTLKPDGSASYINDMAELLYAVNGGALTYSGTVQSITDAVLTLSGEDGETLTFTRGLINETDLNVMDTAEVRCFELNGERVAVGFTKTGTVETAQMRGTVYLMRDDELFLLSGSGVYYFLTDPAMKVTGIADVLREDYDVLVTYVGDLTGTPVVLAAETLSYAPLVTPTPKPTVAPYVTRTTSGTVSSVAGSFVCLNGITFDVKSYTGIDPYAGCYADITYNDYGTGLVVTAANFSEPAVPYSDCYVEGTVTAANGIWITVSAPWGTMNFEVNSARCSVSGKAEVGGTCRIFYRDYGSSVYEVEEAYFTPAPAPDPDPDPAPAPDPVPDPTIEPAPAEEPALSETEEPAAD